MVGAAVTPHGEATAHGAAVDAVGAISAAPYRDTVTMSPDRALVRRLAVDPDTGDVAYELRAYPVIAAGTEVELRWVAPLAYVDGRLRLRIPARGDATWLAGCTGSVTATAPTGARGLADLDAGGALLAAKPGKKAYAFDVGMGEVAIDVRPLLPVATFATAPIDAGGGAVAVAVLRPRAADAPSRFGHVVFLVDTSTSVAADAAARGALAELVDGVATSLRKDAVIDASTTLSTPMLACLREAAYALTVPSYTLTDGPDTVHQIRYPLDFRGESDVAVSDGSGNAPIDTGLDTADPLGDLAH